MKFKSEDKFLHLEFGGKQVFHVICTWMVISDHNPYEHEFETT